MAYSSDLSPDEAAEAAFWIFADCPLVHKIEEMSLTMWRRRRHEDEDVNDEQWRRAALLSLAISQR